MKIGKVGSFLSYVITFLLVFCTGGVARAAWLYTSDPSYDSLAGNGQGGVVAGGTPFEIFFLGTLLDENYLWIGVNGNLPLTGLDTGPSYNGFSIGNGNIGWGDIFLDSSGLGNFKAASDAGRLIGIRAIPNNDSKAPKIGIYDQVKAVSTVPQNGGWSNLGNHNLYGVRPRTGQDAAMGELAWNDPYYADYITPGAWNRPETLIPTVIESGNYLGDVTLLNASDLQAAGFDLSAFSSTGSQTWGVKVDRSLFPIGEHILSWWLECNNDGIATKVNITERSEEPTDMTSVPEPTSVLGLILAGVFGAGTVLKRKQCQSMEA
ncbi:MAG: PEP-CTERM sorting domain-containing protein [Trichocoleus desertorum ATA4-8-CV12]|jgi:hypothetical protein|nr:PEP-CTERM sorting domain-containing protein [Trichocoleus desertorum ATA4-8-CV12]